MLGLGTPLKSVKAWGMLAAEKTAYRLVPVPCAAVSVRAGIKSLELDQVIRLVVL